LIRKIDLYKPAIKALRGLTVEEALGEDYFGKQIK
jgi:hypothetical protein